MARMSYEESKKYMQNLKIVEEKKKEAAINIICILRDEKFTTAEILDIVNQIKEKVAAHSYVSESFGTQKLM